MSTEQELLSRSGSKCELCSTSDNLSVYHVPPDSDKSAKQSILLCSTCQQQVDNSELMDAHHWRCLNDSMWSQTPSVQVMAWRMLSRLSAESWPQNLLDMLYLDDETLAWAKASREEKAENNVKHKDSNGNILQAGDTVILIKDLTVKGAGFTAKRGTAVRGISLVDDNPEHIEGKISGQQIIILAQYVKKSH